MKRLVQPEWLDTLPPGDPRAIRSRRDLNRVNACMGNAQLLSNALHSALGDAAPQNLTELGAGDGRFLLSLAQKMSARWPGVDVTLLDLQNNVAPETLTAFNALGWRPEMLVTDVFNWPPAADGGRVVIANLFLHHFQDPRLADLLRLIAQRTRLFIALEPRRAAWPLFCSRWLWALGCNDVTRHDAVVSVRAGFRDHELSRLWPDAARWHLTEQSAGPFSHLFIAQKLL